MDESSSPIVRQSGMVLNNIRHILAKEVGPQRLVCWGVGSNQRFEGLFRITKFIWSNVLLKAKLWKQRTQEHKEKVGMFNP